MTKDVLVSISGKHIGIVSQSDEVIEAVGTDDDEIEVVTPASYYCRNGKHYIIYDEVMEGMSGSIKNKIKISGPDSLEIMKTGISNSHMVFEKNKKNLTYYRTPYGQMLVGVNTRDMHISVKEDKIDVLVTIGGDDTNGAAKKLYETEGIPVIGFPKTIDNDLRTRTMHHYNGQDIEAVICPGFPSAARTVTRLTNMLRTTTESHKRVMVMEVMGRDAGWLTATAMHGGADMVLIPECPMTAERKEFFFERVKELYMRNRKRCLVIAVSEGTRWYDDETGKVDVVYASSEKDEYGHARFGGVSGVIANEISHRLGLDARSQISGYYARAGECREYDRRLTSTLADKVVDLLLRQAYGQMPVLNKVVHYDALEEFNTSSIDMGSIGNIPLPDVYYDKNTFSVTDAYRDFLGHVMEPMKMMQFDYDFPVVLPENK